jgi:hypothetical protein
VGDSSEFRERIAFLRPVQTSAGDVYVDLGLERFSPSTAFDIASKKAVLVRRRIIERSDTAEIRYPTCTISCADLLDQFEPADGWMTRTEWAQVKKELEPLAERERTIKLAETVHLAADCARRAEAHQARLKPTRSMADGIARGLAQALKNLGINKKG